MTVLLFLKSVVRQGTIARPLLPIALCYFNRKQIILVLIMLDASEG